MKAEKIKQTGYGISGRIFWELNDLDHQPTTEELQRAQEEAGYHPAGYDFFSGTIFCLPNGRWKATWSCSASCD